MRADLLFLFQGLISYIANRSRKIGRLLERGLAYVWNCRIYRK